MSETPEIEMKQGLDPMAVFPGHAEGRAADVAETIAHSIHKIDDTIDGQSYFLGEVPQANLVDPAASLPLNSDRLISAVNVVEKLLIEVGVLLEDEIGAIQKQQKRIAFWEDRIEQNRLLIAKNEQIIKQNRTEALYDKRNRDYWVGRAEEVEIDYSHAEVAARANVWAWLIKKYGLKNADGSEISSTSPCVEELCNGETKNLIAEYRASGNKYERARQEKETASGRLVRENAQMQNANDTLQNYITTAYADEIEPLQDGVLLFKELGQKLKALSQDTQANYGDLRSWAETYLNEFITTNARVSQRVVTQFRRLTSIPLPPRFC